MSSSHPHRHDLVASCVEAKVTVARKLAATVLAMWKNEEVYDSKR